MKRVVVCLVLGIFIFSFVSFVSAVSTNFGSANNLKKVKVAIRPDNLELSTSGENLIQGRVIAAEYQGREYALEVEVDSNTNLIVRTVTATQVGSNISLSVPANRVLVFPDNND